MFPGELMSFSFYALNRKLVFVGERKEKKNTTEAEIGLQTDDEANQ